MTDHQLLAPLPQLSLDAGCSVTFEAIDPDSGAAVAGVTISEAVVYATNAVDGATGGTVTFDPPQVTLALAPGLGD